MSTNQENESTLREELEFFSEALPQLLESAPSKFALIKGRNLIGTYDTDIDAINEGAKRYGVSGFLVREILPQQEEIKIPALALGLIAVV